MSKSKHNLYFENLDGWRGIAVFAVIFAHLSYQIQDNENFPIIIKKEI